VAIDAAPNAPLLHSHLILRDCPGLAAEHELEAPDREEGEFHESSEMDPEDEQDYGFAVNNLFVPIFFIYAELFDQMMLSSVSSAFDLMSRLDFLSGQALELECSYRRSLGR
jgi:hypothetical protein